MAVLDGSRVIPVYVYGQAELIVLFAMKNISAGDTVDLSVIGNNASFQVVNKAILISSTGPAAIAANTGTVITMPAAIPANSAGWMLVWGC
jgi:hypothetical protein